MNILIIDDNPTIRENISLYLKQKGHNSFCASDGEAAFDMISRNHYDFLIVDRMMPRIDGLSLIRMLHWRSIRIPFLFLTALSKQVDKIEGLSLGADDYLVKPFDLQELLLRIENIVRRNSSSTNSKDHVESTNLYHVGDVEIDTTAQRVKKNGHHIEISPKEYGILEILFLNRGVVLDRDFLYEKVWGEYEADEKTLDTINVHIAHLRKKLGAHLIRTVKLSGYIIDNS